MKITNNPKVPKKDKDNNQQSSTNTKKTFWRNPYPWTTRSIVLVPIFVALIVVFSRISIPIGAVPFTLQTLAVGLIASITPIYVSSTAISLYLLLGALGLPVFAGGKGGVAVLFGPTGGYLISFILMCYLIGFFVQINRRISVLIIANTVAALLNLLIGTFWLMVNSDIDLGQAFATGFTPFIFSSIVKIAVIVAASNILLNINNYQLYK